MASEVLSRLKKIKKAKPEPFEYALVYEDRGLQEVFEADDCREVRPIFRKLAKLYCLITTDRIALTGF